MTDLNVSIKVDDKEAVGLLAAVEQAVSGPSLEEFLLGPTEDYLISRIESRFGSEGDDASGKWAPLAQWTILDREAKGFTGDHPINYRTGELHAFLTRRSHVTMVQGDMATLVFPGGGSTSEEAKLRVAQRGLSPNTMPGARPVPARPVAAVDEADAVALGLQFRTWLEEHIRAGGLTAAFSVQAV